MELMVKVSRSSSHRSTLCAHSKRDGYRFLLASLRLRGLLSLLPFGASAPLAPGAHLLLAILFHRSASALVS